MLATRQASRQADEMGQPENEKPNRLGSAGKWALGVGGASVIFAAQTRPEEATSSIAAWLHFIGIDQVPSILAAASADWYVTALGGLAILGAVDLFWRARSFGSRKIVSPVPPQAVPEVPLASDPLSRAPSVPAVVKHAAGRPRHEPSPEPLPDLPIYSVVLRVYEALGGLPKEEAQRPQFRRKVNRVIANAAKLRGLHVWGYQGAGRAADLITADMWESGTFDHMAGTFRVSVGYVDPHVRTYTDLEFNEAEVERIWPPKAPVSPKRDTTVSEALAYAALGRWGEKFSKVPLHFTDWESVKPPVEQFQRAALDRELTVWGKRDFGTVFERIPWTYWREHGLDVQSLMMGRAATVPLVEMESTALYEDLMVNREEVERAWPHAG